MSDDEPLLLPRRLAIRLLHEAQIAQPAAIRGRVLARDARPTGFCLESDADAPAGADVPQTIWAELWSHPSAPAVPLAQELHAGRLSLLISLNIKGVLEMRAWELRAGRPHERVLKLRD